MGKKKSHQTRNCATGDHRHLPKHKRQELNNLVEKLLKVTSINPDGPGIGKLWDLHAESQVIIDRIQQIESEVKSPIHLQNRNASLDTFLSWLKQNDAKFESIKISHFPDYDLGLEATTPITKSSVILEVPQKLMYTSQCCDVADSKKLFDTDKMLTNMPNVALAFALVVERLNKDSFWKPYLDVLPKDYSTVLYYKSNELQELRGSPSLEMALKQCRSIRRQYAYFYKMLWTSSFALFEKIKEKWTYDLYCWAVSTVMTRQNSVPVGEGGVMVPALIPLWDMANYKDGQITTDYIPENQTVQYSALDDYKPGDQVFIFYGERSNAELLVHNGFVCMDNSGDTVSIRLGISPSDPLATSRLKALIDLSLPCGGTSTLCVAKNPAPITPQLLAYARVFNMNQEQLDHWLSSDHIEDLFHMDCALDHELEKKVWTFLLTRLQILLSVYPTTLEADRLALENSAKANETSDGVKLSPATRCAIQLRYSEKLILQDAIEYVKQHMSA
ncbi:histone-lysine N-methyltransferase setd3-like [Ctenocephalides felis]|uniref:histone-lysine N-methyltransferase setd3-like n=1 Tax=Ctenocephalides felis TaxID=7515 RepID=UPI000E6E445F|nr:histone-lysine N-methyltransferase setd3-like [Ctenocephalides felis]